MTKVLCRVGFGKPVCRKLEKELNQLLEDGWEIEKFRVRKIGFFRFMIIVTLDKATESK